MAIPPFVTRANKYYLRSRISEKRFRQLVRFFALDLSAGDTAGLTGLTTKTVNSIYLKIRRRIAQACERESPFTQGEVEVEVDESYFGARRVRGSRVEAQWSSLHRDHANCSKASLQAVIRGRVAPEVVIHSDGWRGYDGLVDVGYAKHFGVQHASNELVIGTHPINGIESFWKVPKGDCKNSMAFPLIPFICIGKSVSGDLTTATVISTMNCSNCSEITQFKLLNYLSPNIIMSTPITYRDRLMDRYALLYDWLPGPDSKNGGGPILDVGCGNGIYTQWLAKKCAPVFGIDHNLKNLNWAKSEFPELHFLMANGEMLPFADEYFNAVMITEVLEHTRDDRSTLREIYRVLKPGGVLLLSTPHKGLFGFLDPDNVTNRAFDTVRKLKIPKPGGGRFYENFRYDIHRHYSAGQLKSLLGKQWQVEEIYYGGLLLYPLLYGVENLMDAFGKKRSYWQDYRVLRALRAFDFNLRFGKLSYNIALRCRKI